MPTCLSGLINFNKQMQLLLSSDGKPAIHNLHLLTDKLSSELNVAWIITAAKGSSNCNFLNRDLQEFLRLGIKPQLYDIESKGIRDFQTDFVNTDIIFVDGGNPFYLLKIMRETKFDKFIKEWVKDKPYVGVSAGTYVACPTIEMATWKNPNRNRHGLDDLTALGLIDFLITAHYTDSLQGLISEKSKRSEKEIKKLRDGELLFINNTL